MPFLRPILNAVCRLVLLPLALAALPAWAKVEVRVEPEIVGAGEVGTLIIASDSDQPRVNDLPTVSGLNWIAGPQTSMSVSFDNFKKTVRATTSFLFQVDKPGAYTIPAFNIKVGKELLETKPVSFRVTAAAIPPPAPAPPPAAPPDGTPSGAESAPGSLTLPEAFFAEIATLPGGAASDTWYPGQEIPVEIRVHVAAPVFSDLRQYPELKLDNAAFLDPVPPNPQSRQYAPLQEGRETRKGVPFRVFVFRTRMTPLAPGKVQAEAACTAILRFARQASRPPPNSPFNSEFFRDFLNQPVEEPRTVTVPLGPLTVKLLPPPPADTPFLGLVGDWKVRWSVTPASVAAGDPVTLSLDVTGRGNLETLVPPKLNLPGFRVFDPEVKKETTGDSSHAGISWVVVPLQANAKLPELAAATFRPAEGDYSVARFRPQLLVGPGLVKPPGTTVVDSSTASSPSRSPAAIAPAGQHDLLYLKPGPDSGVRLPLWRNTGALAAGILAAALAIFTTVLFLTARRDRLQSDPAYRRKIAARKELHRLLGRIRNAPTPDRARLVCDLLVPCLAAQLDLSPGTTAAGVAERIAGRHPQLAALLRQAGEDAFRPGGGRAFAVDELARLAAKVRSLLLPAALLGLFLAAAGSNSVRAAASEPIPGPEAELRRAQQCYDQGKLEEAWQIYRTLCDRQPESPVPTLLFNEANCLFRLGRPAEALAKFETARRLAPRDSDILENLNFVRTQLDLPRAGAVETPADLLRTGRDLLRPDEWLLAAAILLAAGLLGAAWQRWRNRPFWPAAVSGLIAALLCGGCLLAQLQDLYRSGNQAVLIPPRPLTYPVPDAGAEPGSLPLRQGESVLIQETRGEWSRIRAGNTEAWIRNADLARVW